MFLKMIVVIAMLFVNVPSIQAASPQDVQMVIRLTQTSKSSQFLRKKNHFCGGNLIVFIRNDNKYSVGYCKSIEGNAPSIAIRLQPQGNAARKVKEFIFIDNDVDGRLDDFSELLGIEGQKPCAGKTAAWCDSYHQHLYDQAITNTVAFFEGNP